MRDWRPFAGRTASLGVVVAAHAAMLGGLLAFEPGRTVVREISPLLVRMIEPEPVRIEPPKPEPPKLAPKPPPPKPAVRTPKPPPPPLPVLALPESIAAPAPVEVPVPPPEPVVQPPIEAPPAPVVAAVAPIAVTAPPPPPPIEPPRFDADYLLNPAPAYPDRSRRLGEEGKVLVRVLVGVSGQPMKVELRQSSGFERLDQAALAAIAQWRFVPAKQGERAVAAWVIVPLVFRLGVG